MRLHNEIRSLADIPRHYGKKTSDKTALIGDDRRLTFKDLDLASNRIANAILKGGCRRSSHIAFIGKNSVEYFEILFAVNKAGCAMLPLNWRLSPAELAAVVEDAETPLVFVDKEFVGLLAQVRVLTSTNFIAIEFDSTSRDNSQLNERMAGAPDSDPCIEIQPRDTALLLYTSGTTGKPKGVQLTHEGLMQMRVCEHLEPAYEWRSGDVMMCVMPIFHMVGTGLSIQGIYNGIQITILPALDIPRVLDVIAKDRPTIVCLVPTAIQMLLDHPDTRSADFSSLRMVWYSGSPISSKLLNRALTEMKCEFMQFYGATETGGAVMLLRPEQHDPDDERKLKSCGTPLPLVEIRVVDADGKDVPAGSVGEFVIRTPSLFKGYWKQEELTATVLSEGWYRTGDAGYRDTDGLYYIVDRTKDMIISGGENIYSAEVEQALIKHPAVSQVAVVGVPDQHWGEKVTAAVVLAAGETATEEELMAHCRTLIAGYKVPKMISFISSFPMTSTGKVLKTALRAQLSANSEPAAT